MKSLDSWAGQRQVLYPDPILGQGGYLFILDQEVGYDDVEGGGGCGSTIPFARRRDRHRAIDANGKSGKQQGPLAPVIGCQPRRTGNVWIVCRSRFLILLPGMSATGHGGGSMQPPAVRPSSPVLKRNGGGEAWFLLGLPGSVFCWVSKRCQVLFFCPCPANGLKAFAMTSPLPAPPVSTTNFFQTPLCDDGEILAPF